MIDCDGFKLREKRFRLGMRKKGFYNQGGETLAEADQRGGGCPIPGDTQGQAGWGSEHLMELWVSLFIEGELDQKLEGSLPNLTGL